MSPTIERRLLQLAVAGASIVPLLAGGAGVIEGPGMADGSTGTTATPANLDSHFRYMSGLLLGIGIAFVAAIPTIERRGELFAVLGFLVVVGGLARLTALAIYGPPGTTHVLALVMELGVVPTLFLWQRRIARLYRNAPTLD